MDREAAQQLTAEEAKRRLEETAQDTDPLEIIRRHPKTAALAALALGVVVSRSPRARATLASALKESLDVLL